MKCGAGGTFVKRIIGLPGDRLQLRLIKGNGYVFINGRKLNEPYIQAQRRAPATPYPASGGVFTVPKGQYFMMGDNRSQFVRLALLGHRAAQEHHRQGLHDLLAAEPRVVSLAGKIRDSRSRESRIARTNP